MRQRTDKENAISRRSRTVLLDARPNAPALMLAARRERGAMLLLFAPAFVLLAALVLLPVGWLFYLSFVEGANYSLAHYERMLTYSSYATILWVTLKISIIVSVICVLVGYPVAYLLAQLPRAVAVLSLSLVIVPFWTSILVRTYAWLVLLGANGPISPLLNQLGILSDPLGLLYNQVGTTIGMTHIMLPFFILPLYAVLRSFDWSLMQAASSLGAPPISAFLRVFLPLSLPGVWAGAVLVFIQALGFYITPALLGGGKVTFVSMKIASNVQEYFDWGAASAFGVVLLLSALLILAIASRFIGLERALGVSR
jgi:putative spermidine/putrescine transport system permease protein/spermidine/putrescine transport system permease protein